MKKNAFLCLVVLCLAVFFYLSSFVLGRDVERELRGKGIHVAHLSGEDKISLQINRLEQAIRLQWVQPGQSAPRMIPTGVSLVGVLGILLLLSEHRNLRFYTKIPTQPDEKTKIRSLIVSCFVGKVAQERRVSELIQVQS